MRSHQLKQTTGAFVAVTAMAALSAYCTTKFLVRVAVDRKSPHVMEKAGNLLSRTQEDDLFLSELDTAAKRLEEKENETVKINAADGVALVGHFIPCEHPKRVSSPCTAGALPGPRISEPWRIFGRITIAVCCTQSKEGRTTAAAIICPSA